MEKKKRRIPELNAQEGRVVERLRKHPEMMERVLPEGCGGQTAFPHLGKTGSRSIVAGRLLAMVVANGQQSTMVGVE